MPVFSWRPNTSVANCGAPAPAGARHNAEQSQENVAPCRCDLLRPRARPAPGALAVVLEWKLKALNSRPAVVRRQARDGGQLPEKGELCRWEVQRQVSRPRRELDGSGLVTASAHGLSVAACYRCPPHGLCPVSGCTSDLEEAR